MYKNFDSKVLAHILCFAELVEIGLWAVSYAELVETGLWALWVK